MDISTVMAYALVVNSLRTVIQNLLEDNEQLTNRVINLDNENAALKEEIRQAKISDNIYFK